MTTYPAGVLTSPVSLAASGVDAKTAGGQWTVKAVQSLLFGDVPVLLRPITVSAGSEPADLTVDLPVSSQTGFTDAVTGLAVNPTYVATYQPIASPALTSIPFPVVADEITKVAPLLPVRFWPYSAAVGTGPGGVAAGEFVDQGGGLFLFVPTGGSASVIDGGAPGGVSTASLDGGTPGSDLGSSLDGGASA